MIRNILLVILLLVSATGQAQVGSFWENHELVMLFSSQCPHCQNMGLTVSRFLKRSPLPFRGLSIDGRGVNGITSFERVTPDFIKAAFSNNDVVYPATFILETQTLKIYPLAKGALSEQALTARINILVPKIMQFEQGSLS